MHVLFCYLAACKKIAFPLQIGCINIKKLPTDLLPIFTDYLIHCPVLIKFPDLSDLVHVHFVLQQHRQSLPCSQPLPTRYVHYSTQSCPLTFEELVSSSCPCILLWHPLTHTLLLLQPSMPFMSLPTEVHRMILLQIDDHRLLLKLSRTNHYFRVLFMTLPARAMQSSINALLTHLDKSHFWDVRKSWEMLYDFESEKVNRDFLDRADMIPCYYCCKIWPRNAFGNWAFKRTTELDHCGVPLAGVCLCSHDKLHRVFQWVMDNEEKGEHLKLGRDLAEGSYSYLQLIWDLREGMWSLCREMGFQF